MKQLKSESGYTLLVALLLLMVFAILGTGIMALTLSGTQRNETRQEIIQSNDLAEKGIDRITAQITQELDAAVTADGISASDYLSKFRSIISKYTCSGGSAITDQAAGNTGDQYSVCISSDKPDPESLIDINGRKESLRRILTFKSTGASGDADETYYSVFNIGATQHPEVLNYAVGAYKIPGNRDTTRFPPIPGEGNLVLNGGSSIEGDIKVDGDLITSDNGVWRSTNNYGTTDYSVPSVFPQLSGYNSDSGGKISVDGSMYRFKQSFPSNSFNYERHVDGRYVTDTRFYEKTANLANLFWSTPPRQIRSDIEMKPINFDEKRNALSISPTSSNSYNTGNRNLSNVTRAQDTYLMVRSCFWLWCSDDYGGTYSLTGRNTFGRLGTSGNLQMTTTDTTFTKGAYVGGSLDIRSSNSRNPSRITGTVFVRGNLNIENAYLQSDVIFYVEGDVSITESQIYGIPYSDRTGSLIIFAKGDIKLSNNSEFLDTPSEFKGYFYSEKIMEIYGVGSNIKIDGGISARKIILNAVRGRAYSTSSYQSQAIQRTLPKNKSRLQIIYDKDIIKNYSELDIQTEPWIENVSPPQELDRRYSE